ncbi:hypothetical protein [Paucisalibacillus sp. EB02]|uniref:hypothetical protein n=1 Tax=Paucisalibacillus sp. EB02 TaxID=1347087 RepID=UPI000693C8E2|nr:hypothetical protein [Paucisalibacillus sp. EB02]
MHNVVRTYLLNRLNFLRMDELELTDKHEKEFEDLYENYILNGVGDEFPYLLNEQKYKFLTYLIENKNILVHGSNNPDINVFEPRNSTLFTGEKVKAVFASSDATWSTFFAVINRNDYSGSLRNLCLTAQTDKGTKRYYYFSLNEEFTGELWQVGMIYLFPKDRFEPGGAKNEWISEKEVYPLAKLLVSPEEFIFRDFIERHREDSSHIRNLVKHLLLSKWKRKR